MSAFMVIDRYLFLKKKSATAAAAVAVTTTEYIPSRQSSRVGPLCTWLNCRSAYAASDHTRNLFFAFATHSSDAILHFQFVFTVMRARGGATIFRLRHSETEQMNGASDSAVIRMRDWSIDLLTISRCGWPIGRNVWYRQRTPACLVAFHPESARTESHIVHTSCWHRPRRSAGRLLANRYSAYVAKCAADFFQLIKCAK